MSVSNNGGLLAQLSFIIK